MRTVLAKGAANEETIAAHFVRKPVKSVAQILSALSVLGHATEHNKLWRLAG